MSEKRHMFIWSLETGNDKRRAVAIAPSHDLAILQAMMVDPYSGWREARVTKLTECRATMTPRVVALERKIK